MRCGICGSENEDGRRFCGECGAQLTIACPSCGAPNPPTVKFCGDCGSRLIEGSAAAAVPSRGPVEAERRLVSVLFADLVGFTSLSESRDPEEVRELLSRYFDTCRTLIGRYGGVVEKFIGDAVMAVWGTPTANEDDAERAVRAALDLVDAVAALGEEVGAADLRARAGVLTGEAAVSLQAEGQGMVAGDLVNTASRIQAAASPGSVYVGDTTQRATEAAIAYEDAGPHELKGKSEPMTLFRALRVVAAVGGEQRSVGLEAPFVGRDREMRVIKELFHVTADESRAQLVSVAGPAGIGKSRLVWELFKYIDGLVDPIRWHRGRCLAYGEGVTYWALAEMVRTRAGILEGEDPESALPKLREAVAETLAEPEERRWVEPRLAHLLGLEEGPTRAREDLFSAWRLFYERLADEMPTVMVFEDLHWADPSLLDFIDYLLEWSKDNRLFIVTTTRPELSDRRPNWGSGKRSTSLHLEPLGAAPMDALLDGLVPGLPGEVGERVRERAEGVPLYAVETVRMLLDRGALSAEGGVYRPTGDIGALEVPETLHALIAARLDGLSPAERSVVQDGAVLGKTFTRDALEVVSGAPADELEATLGSLLRKELLSVQADPLSPDRGQYGFLGDLVRRVAYETLSKRDRKARHLAAAEYLQRTYEEEDVIEVVAAHYRQAFDAAPDAPDAQELAAKVRETFSRAGERAASLGANEEALRYLDEAAALADDPAEGAGYLERSGLSARAAGDNATAVERFERSVALFEEAGHGHPAARVSARMGEAMWDTGRLADAVDRMERALARLSDEEPDEDLAVLIAQLGRFLYFSGRADAALEKIEIALDLAESFYLPEVLSAALNTKAVVIYAGKGRRREGFAILRYALEIAIENDLPGLTLRALYNLSDVAAQSDRYQESREYVEQGLALARRVGNRAWEWNFLGQAYSYFVLGEWDLILERLAEIPEEKFMEARVAIMTTLALDGLIHLHRGEDPDSSMTVTAISGVESSADVQEQAALAAAVATRALAKGDAAGALASTIEAYDSRHHLGSGSEFAKEGAALALDAAFEADDLDRARWVLNEIESEPRGKRLQSMDALALRFRGRLAAREGDLEGADRSFKGAAGLYRELGVQFPLALTLLDFAAWLAETGRAEDAKPHLDEAREIFERLRAAPALGRLEEIASSIVAAS